MVANVFGPCYTGADNDDATPVAEAAAAAGGVCYQSSILLVTV